MKGLKMAITSIKTRLKFNQVLYILFIIINIVTIDSSVASSGWNKKKLLSISNDNQFAIVSSSKGHGFLVSILDERLVNVFETEEKIIAANFSFDGKFLILAKENGIIEIWDINEIKKATQFNVDATITDVAISPDNKYVVGVLNGEEFVLFDLKTGNSLKSITMASAFDSAKIIKLNSGGGLAHIYLDNNTIKVRKLMEGLLVGYLQVEEEITSISASPIPNYFCYLTKQNIIELWKWIDIKVPSLGKRKREHLWRKQIDDFLINGIYVTNTYLFIMSDSTLKAYHIETGEQINNLSDIEISVSSLSIESKIEEKIIEDMEKAIKFESIGEKEKAIEIYKLILSKDGSYLPAIDKLSVAYLQSGKVAESLRLFRKATEINPDDPDTHYNLALTLYTLDKIEEAKNEFEKSLSLYDPLSADNILITKKNDAMTCLSSCYLRLDKFNKAIDILDEMKYGKSFITKNQKKKILGELNNRLKKQASKDIKNENIIEEKEAITKLLMKKFEHLEKSQKITKQEFEYRINMLIKECKKIGNENYAEQLKNKYLLND